MGRPRSCHYRWHRKSPPPPKPERVATPRETAKQFRRVNGHLHLPALRAALDATVAVTPTKEDAA